MQTQVPERMMASIGRYVVHGILPGSFLRAVISNDLRGAFENADSENIRCLDAYVRHFYNEEPAQCWGSKEKMLAWSAAKQAAQVAA